MTADEDSGMVTVDITARHVLMVCKNRSPVKGEQI